MTYKEFKRLEEVINIIREEIIEFPASKGIISYSSRYFRKQIKFDEYLSLIKLYQYAKKNKDGANLIFKEEYKTFISLDKSVKFYIVEL